MRRRDASPFTNELEARRSKHALRQGYVVARYAKGFEREALSANQANMPVSGSGLRCALIATKHGLGQRSHKTKRSYPVNDFRRALSRASPLSGR